MSIIDNLYYYVNTKRLKEQGHNLTTLSHALSNITEPFSVKASLHSDELSKGFISIDGPSTRYQVLYLALNHNNEFYLTTSPKSAQAYIPVTNIYDYGFSRISVLREELNSIAKTYSKELREFVFNHTHKYIATMITGGIEDVAVVIAPERKINNQKGE